MFFHAGGGDVKSSLYFFLVIFNLYFGTFEFGARDM
jgi:hypothetical protein